MRITLALFTIFLAVAGIAQNRIDFGIESQVNSNQVKKWTEFDKYDPSGLSVSVLDIDQDTLDIYFDRFSMENNFEIPIYFRFNRNRHFLDFKLSNSFNTLKMDGYANYNRNYFESNYGTYQEFEAQALADGFSSVDTADYENYIANAQNNLESNISYIEKFQLLSLTVNYGFRFLPHKSIKPFFSTGFTVKGKYRKINYDYLDFSNDYVQDVSAINVAISEFAETSMYMNFIIGAEVYRFRLSAYFQTGIAFTFPINDYGPGIVYASGITPFDQLYSFGLNMGVDLFRQDFGNKIHIDDLTKDDLEASKIRRKDDKWDIGVTFSRRGFNELTTYYGDSTSFLSLMTRDSVLVNDNGSIKQGTNIEMVQFGDIKKIGWSPEIDIYGTYHFNKRFLADLSWGFSRLTFDVATKELVATISNDSLGNSYYVQTGNLPSLKSGVYRKAFDMSHLKLGFAYKLVDRDIFDLKFNMGFGLTVMRHRLQFRLDQPAGVNELDIYEKVEDAYFVPIDEDLLVNNTEGFTPNLNDSPDEVISKFTADKNISNVNLPQPFSLTYPTFHFGITGSIDRFSLGMTFERSLRYMDGFILNQFGTIYFSIGYKIWSR